MFENYINKKCEAIVLFADSRLESGSQPLRISGILESYDNDYMVLKTKKGKSIILIKALLVLNIEE